MRTFVLGLDGLDWDLVKDWTSKGLLPNMKELMRRGVSGRLESTIPFTTPPGWTSITTGVNPGKHGLFDFFRVSWSDSGWVVKLVNSRDKRSPELWDYVPKSVVINLPISYPAKRIDGVMVTGMLTPSLNDKSTYPPEFAQKISDLIPDYKFELKWSMYVGNEGKFLRDLIEVTGQREKLIRHLIGRDWNLFFAVIACTDRVQHLSFGTDVMREYFGKVDELLGDLMEGAERGDYNLIVVSDHGFGPVDRSFYPNRLFLERGLLVPRGNIRVVDRGTLKRWLRKVGMLKLALKIYRRLGKAPPGLSRPDDFDPDKSEAIAYGYGSVYVKRPEVINEVKGLLEEVRDPETGEKVVEKIYLREELYRGPHLKLAPHLIAVLRPGYSVEREAYQLFGKSDKRGDHTINGVFMAMGPEIGQGAVEAKVYDVMPTVMHLLGMPIPEVDGRVLPVFREGTEPYEREPRTMTRREVLRERMRRVRWELKR